MKFFLIKYSNLLLSIFVFVCLLLLSILASFYKILGNFLKNDLNWLSNLIAPIMLFGIFIGRKESIGWRYKKKAETSANILSAFRILSSNIKDIVDKRVILPSSKEEENINYEERKNPEVKIDHYWSEFFARVNPLIVYFPTKIADKLEISISELHKLIKQTPGQIRILNEFKSFTKENVIQATQALSELPKKFEQFDKDFKIILSKYIDVFD